MKNMKINQKEINKENLKELKGGIKGELQGELQADSMADSTDNQSDDSAEESTQSQPLFDIIFNSSNATSLEITINEFIKNYSNNKNMAIIDFINLILQVFLMIYLFY